MSNITEFKSWKKLQSHYDAVKGLHLRDLFKEDPERAGRFSLQFEDLLLDYSNQCLFWRKYKWINY